VTVSKQLMIPSKN